MLEAIKKFFGITTIDYKQLMQEGAIILDVRMPGEFSSGHIPKSINIPVDRLANNLNKLKNKATPVITCCASGMRSATAKRILLSKGYANVYNGGSWNSLYNKIKA
ncbi:MAG: rhodanese-like domain-containing protein [Bacteroidetes bacterium]|nr:rhodanese-like domain-containing protein [Bacteroidota bacterium]